MRYKQYLNTIALRLDDANATPPFTVMLVMAFSCHLMILMILSLVSVGAPPNVPVKTILLRLGGGEVAEEALPKMAAITPSAPAKAQERSTKSAATPPSERPEPQQAARPAPVKPVSTSPRREAAKASAALRPAAGKQSTLPRGVGSPLGNTREARAAAMARYEQLLSAWIEKHKIYPKEAYEQGMQGRVLLRIRIDRSGQVLFSRVEQSSGFALLDQAVMATMQRAAPVPAVPQAYPGGKLLEFRIPIDFKVGR